MVGGRRNHIKILRSLKVAWLIASCALAAEANQVAFYPLEGNANDQSGNGNNGVAFGGVSYGTGRICMGASFDGATGNIRVPDSVSLRPSKFTIAAWVKQLKPLNPPFTRRGRIAEKGESNSYYLYLNESAHLVFGFFDGLYHDLISASSLPVGAWQFVAGTYDGAALKIYVNGTFDASLQLFSSPRTTSDPLVIGWKYNGISDDFFQGLLDEVRIYDEALSASQIQELYNLSPNPPLCEATGVIVDGGFEMGNFGPSWIIDGTSNPPVVTSEKSHSGTYSARLGNVTGTGSPGNSSFYQQFTVPASGGSVSFWHWDYAPFSSFFNWQDAYITDSSGTVLATIFHQVGNGQTWVNTLFDVTPYAGQTIRIKFLVHDGGNAIAMYVDDVTFVQPCATTVQSAVSRKTHGSAGDFDVGLPLTGTPGIECRFGGGTNDYEMVVTFSNAVAVSGNPQAQVTSGNAEVGSGGVGNCGAVMVNGSTVTIPLTNVANAQTINVTLFDVNGSNTVVIPMSILSGDTSANGFVNSSDISLAKSRSGQAVDSTNFREDVNANGAINGSDVSLIKLQDGTWLP
jgi:hypothetical protein